MEEQELRLSVASPVVPGCLAMILNKIGGRRGREKEMPGEDEGIREEEEEVEGDG